MERCLGKPTKNLLGKTVIKILISDCDTFISAQEVSIDAPVVLCQTFNSKFISYDIKADELVESVTSEPLRNAFEVLTNRAEIKFCLISDPPQWQYSTW